MYNDAKKARWGDLWPWSAAHTLTFPKIDSNPIVQKYWHKQAKTKFYTPKAMNILREKLYNFIKPNQKN